MRRASEETSVHLLANKRISAILDSADYQQDRNQSTQKGWKKYIKWRLAGRITPEIRMNSFTDKNVYLSKT